MNVLKTATEKVSGNMARQILTVKSHSPVLLFGMGIVGVTTTAVLACRATLKLSDVLEEAETQLQDAETAEFHLNKENSKEEWADTVANKTKFGIRLQTAIKVGKLYAPAVLVGVASVGALTGSHIILKRRNAALTAAYAVVDKSFKQYRARVIADQGAEKDLEYRFGTAEREIVEEGPNGPETRVIKGPDAEAIRNLGPSEYAVIFDELNPNWSPVGMNNQFFVNMVQNHANDKLIKDGYIFLNDVYDMLGMDRTLPGQVVGWVRKPKIDPETGAQTNDTYVDFGIWNEGTFQGKEWVKGNKDGILLDFNVDGVVLDILPKKV